MGATSWYYFTPHRSDPEEALQRLRAETFSRGEYVDVTGPLENVLRRMAQRFGRDPDSPEVRSEIDLTLRIQRAIETGDIRGLSRGDRSLVQRARAMSEFARMLGAAPPRRHDQRPRSIEELLELAAECGTHSILDIEHVARRPGFAVAAPMTLASLRRVFGTAEPTHDQVEDRWADIAERLGRWQARYLVVHDDRHPKEYAFVGCSGD
jgi:hypothetical protein